MSAELSLFTPTPLSPARAKLNQGPLLPTVAEPVSAPPPSPAVTAPPGPQHSESVVPIAVTSIDLGINDDKLLLTEREAAKALSVCPRTLWQLRNDGEIPCVRFGRAVRYAPADLRAWIARQRA